MVAIPSEEHVAELVLILRLTGVGNIGETEKAALSNDVHDPLEVLTV